MTFTNQGMIIVKVNFNTKALERDTGKEFINFSKLSLHSIMIK